MKLTATWSTARIDERTREFKRGAAQRLRAIAQAMQVSLAESIREKIATTGGQPGQAAGAQLGSRSGALRDAFLPGRRGNISELNDHRTDAFATLGIDSKEIPYWSIHEYGGTIKARRVKYLTIPMHADAARTTARKVPDLFPLAVRDKLFLVKGKQGALDFWYQLKSSVTIKARPYIAPGVEAFRTDGMKRHTEPLRLDLEKLWNAS